MMALLRFFPIVMMCVCLLTSCGLMDAGKEDGEVSKKDSLPLIVSHARKCSRLYTTECQVRKIVTHDDQLKLSGSIIGKEVSVNLPFGDRKVAIPIDLTLKAYVDFSGFSESNIKRHGDNIEIILPDPKVVITSSKIDHEGVVKHVSIIRSSFSDEELSLYEQQGREAVVNSIPKLGVLDKAKENAALVLVPMLTGMGYEEQNIKVTFRKEFTISDISRMIENIAGKH